MSKIHLVDTNVLLRHILDDHPDLSQKQKKNVPEVEPLHMDDVGRLVHAHDLAHGERVYF
ncbi:MAG: hypothetical protein ACMUIL_13890 [bacterium]